MSKVYIGDSVYVEYRGRQLKLTTNNGGLDLNTIYLEPEVVSALFEYIAKMRNVRISVGTKDESPTFFGEPWEK